jgi:hypothetical protein
VIGNLTRMLESVITPDTLGGFAVTNAKDSEVIFGIPGEDSEVADLVLVYNTRTQAWSRWFANTEAPDFTCAAYDGGRLMFGTGDSGRARLEREPNADVVTADLPFTLDIDSVSANGVVQLGSSVAGWTPALGDLIEQGGNYAIITALEDDTEFTVDEPGSLSAGAATAYQGYAVQIGWLPKVGEGPAIMKRHTEVTTHWESIVGLQRWQVLYNSIIGGTGNASSPTYTRERAETEYPVDHRALVPRNVNLGSRLIPGLLIRQANARWRVSGVTMIAEPLSTRVSR